MSFSWIGSISGFPVGIESGGLLSGAGAEKLGFGFFAKASKALLGPDPLGVEELAVGA